MDEQTKAPDRLEVLKKIEECEKCGNFSAEVENDLPTLELKPEDIDYKRKKLSNRLKRFFTYKIAGKMLNKMKKAGLFRMEQVEGLENLKSAQFGGVITCNHFGVIDSFIMDQAFRQAQFKHKRMFRVIREGNYTNPPKDFASILRNCDTLPLSQNKQTMRKFLRSTNELLQEGNFVLIYPEESMWWNYRKPRPFQNGAFRFAVKNKLPVVPVFITMQDSNQIGTDGFPIQIHTVHIEKPIYADPNLDEKQNIEQMKQQNYAICKRIYEHTYGIPLVYNTIK